MNTLSTVGPVQLVALAYFICIIVSLGVAWLIFLLFSGIKWQRNIFLAKTIAVKVTDKKEISIKKEK